MNSSNQGNSQGGSQDNQQSAPSGGMQSGTIEQEVELVDEELAFGEVRRAERVRQQRLNRVRGQSER